MRKYLFMQFRDKMFDYDPFIIKHLNKFYKKNYKNGFRRFKYNLEIPKWIAEASYFIPDDKEIYWCDNLSKAVKFINKHNPDYVLFSLMSCNKNFIKRIIKECPYTNFILGGYDKNGLKELNKYSNTKIVYSMSELADYLNYEYKYGTDYLLFENMETIPRLTMSTGCLNNCKFCTVLHKEVKAISQDCIIQQVLSFAVLNFQLIYIDDKTFGQCNNINLLKLITHLVKKYNKQFKGFIIQTTPNELIKKHKLFAKLGVQIAEIGIESYNDYILKKYNKPCNENIINKCIHEVDDIKLLPNLIVGFPEETHNSYAKTYQYILEHKNKFCGVNIAKYTNYKNVNNNGEIKLFNDTDYDKHKTWWIEFCKL